MISSWRKIFPGVLCVLCCSGLHGCLTFREKPQAIEGYLQKKNVPGKVGYYKAEGRMMQYAAAGDSAKPVVLFIHGSPGSLSAFANFLTDSSLLKQGYLISADRPGFGYSNFGVGEKSLQKQAAILKTLIELKHKGKPVILVGHSLGGPVIARIAMDYPNLIDGLVIVAGSIDPELEPNEAWWRGPLASPFLSFILPRSLRASNYELYHLKPELEKMIPYWDRITCPVVVVHGRKDPLVDFENVTFAKEKLTNAEVEFILHDTANHFIPWEHPELINQGIELVLQKATVFNNARQVSLQ